MSDWYCEELLTGNTPVERVFEDESVIAFWHTRPHYAHHVVVTPRFHVDSLLDCDGGTLTSLFEVVKAIAAQFTSSTAVRTSSRISASIRSRSTCTSISAPIKSRG